MPHLAARRRRTGENLKLRRLTQAYLTPYEELKQPDTGVQRIDEIYAMS